MVSKLVSICQSFLKPPSSLFSIFAMSCTLPPCWWPPCIRPSSERSVRHHHHHHVFYTYIVYKYIIWTGAISFVHLSISSILFGPYPLIDPLEVMLSPFLLCVSMWLCMCICCSTCYAKENTKRCCRLCQDLTCGYVSFVL